jgi:hypothetical protein
MAQATPRVSLPHAGGTLARRTALGVLVAILALLTTQAIVDAAEIAVGVTGAMSPFATAALVGSTIAAGVGAALTYAAVDRFTARPVRNFVAIAAAVFVVMLVPVFVVAPAMGVTPTGQGLLVLYHLLVAVPLTAFIVGAVGR